MERSNLYNSEPGQEDREISLKKFVPARNRSFQFVIGFAMVYCVAYGIILIDEFSRMGVLDKFCRTGN